MPVLKRLSPALLVLAVAALALAPAAGAEVRTEEFTYGPITVSGYQVKQDFVVDVPRPDVDGYIVGMEADIVDRAAGGRRVPISRLMLHHVVFANAGQRFGDRRDRTCGTFTMLDSKTTIPAIGERFYAAGEERAKLALPDGYGYPVRRGERWLMTWMVMNHRPVQDTAHIRYRVTYDTERRAPAHPYWLDIANCLTDPVYDVPGGGSRGSTHSRTYTWRPPTSGRIVAGGGHVHGGAKYLELTRPGCPDPRLARLRPTWGRSTHPFYRVKPVLHEPGPIHMSGFTSPTGIPVGAGEAVRLRSAYDGELPHPRVMGIALLYKTEEPVDGRCGAVPADLRHERSPEAGRSRTPRVVVPLTGLDSRGRARTIRQPPGRRVARGKRTSVRVGDLYFDRPNISVPQGATVTWRFRGNTLHNVTLANGPRGFGSVNLNGSRTYRRKLSVPGTYRLFCTLHPVDMSQTVVVRRKSRGATGRR
jgi:plastocyanin